MARNYGIIDFFDVIDLVAGVGAGALIGYAVADIGTCLLWGTMTLKLVLWEPTIDCSTPTLPMVSGWSVKEIGTGVGASLGLLFAVILKVGWLRKTIGAPLLSLIDTVVFPLLFVGISGFVGGALTYWTIGLWTCLIAGTATAAVEGVSPVITCGVPMNEIAIDGLSVTTFAIITGGVIGILAVYSFMNVTWHDDVGTHDGLRERMERFDIYLASELLFTLEIGSTIGATLAYWIVSIGTCLLTGTVTVGLDGLDPVIGCHTTARPRLIGVPISIIGAVFGAGIGIVVVWRRFRAWYNI